MTGPSLRFLSQNINRGPDGPYEVDVAREEDVIMSAAAAPSPESEKRPSPNVARWEDTQTRDTRQELAVVRALCSQVQPPPTDDDFSGLGEHTGDLALEITGNLVREFIPVRLEGDNYAARGKRLPCRGRPLRGRTGCGQPFFQDCVRRLVHELRVHRPRRRANIPFGQLVPGSHPGHIRDPQILAVRPGREAPELCGSGALP